MLVDPEMRQIAQNELEDGERLLWSGRPSPTRAGLESLGIWLFAIPWTAFALFWIWGASGLGMGRSLAQPGLTMNFLFPFFGLPFVFIGLAMLSAPYWGYRKAQRTVYAITDKRVLIIEAGKSRKVRSYSAKDIGNIERTEQADGTGNLTFAQEFRTDSDGDRRTSNINFVGIPEVRSVEILLRNTFKQEKE